MKNLLFGLIATVLFSFNGNANTGSVNLFSLESEKVISINNEQPPVIRGKIIKLLIAAISWFGSSDSPSSVSATGAYSNQQCDARNTNVCNINYRLSNTQVLDIKQLNTNSTVLETPVMRNVLQNDLTFLSFDEHGSVYLTASENTKDKLFTSGNILQINSANIESEQLNYINKVLKEINPKSVSFSGIKAGKTLVPEIGGDGFVYIKLN